MHEGCYFGEIGCLMGGIRRASIKAESVCELQALSRRNLNVLLSEYPDVADELKQVAKNRANTVKSQNTNDAKAATSDSEQRLSSHENIGNTKRESPNVREIAKAPPSTIVNETTNTSPLKNDNSKTKQSSGVKEIQIVNSILDKRILSMTNEFEVEIVTEIESFLKTHLTRKRERIKVPENT